MPAEVLPTYVTLPNRLPATVEAQDQGLLPAYDDCLAYRRSLG